LTSPLPWRTKHAPAKLVAWVTRPRRDAPPRESS
jgi:hypothetical protein